MKKKIEKDKMATTLNIIEALSCFIHGATCRIFGHKWRYNLQSLPNKAICKRCKVKVKLDLHNLEWGIIKAFEGEKRTDDELCRAWSHKHGEAF